MRVRITGSALAAFAILAAASLPVAANPSAAVGHAIASQAQAAPKKAMPVTAAKLVDINSASREQLMTLPGIGQAQADKVVAGRPYLSKADLVANQAIPAGVYLLLKDKVIARQGMKRPPAGKGQ